MNSECLIGISDVFSAFCLQASIIFPTCSLYPQQNLYIQVHACRHIPSAVSWISEDRQLWTLTVLIYLQRRKMFEAFVHRQSFSEHVGFVRVANACWNRVLDSRGLELNGTLAKRLRLDYYDYWLLLNSAILRSWADSLCSCHMWLWMCGCILNSFCSFFFFFLRPPKQCTDSAIWSLHGWCYVKLQSSRCMFCVHHTTMHQFTVSSHTKPYRQGAYVFRCTLPPALLAEWLRSSTCYCSNTGGAMKTKIRVSAESWPRRRKLSCRYCGDSNWGPFDCGPGALTTEPSLLPDQAEEEKGRREESPAGTDLL